MRSNGMRIKVKVNAGAQSESVKRLSDGSYQVRTRAPATRGKANRRVLELLAEHLQVGVDELEIAAGLTSQIKYITVNDREE